MLKRDSVRGALAGLSLSMLMPSLDTSIANVALPTLAQEFSASFHQIQWVVAAYLVAVTLLIVTLGHLGDRVGRRRLLLAGIGVFTGASLLCGAATALWMLIGARIAQGLGAAVMLALGVAMVGDTVGHTSVGKAMGLLGTVSAIGTTLGPVLGGVLIGAFGWRSVFLVNLPIGVVNALIVYRFLPDGRGDTRAAVGADLLALGTLRSPALRASLAMSVLVSAVVMTTLVLGPFYLSRALGLNAALVGLVMSAGPLVAALTGVPGGRLVDRLGARRVAIGGLVAMSAGSVALSLIRVSDGIAGYVGPIAVLTAGYALFQAANNTAVMTSAGSHRRGAVAGLLALSRNLGLIAGSTAMGAVFAAATGDIADARPDAVATGLHLTFALAAVLTIAALALALQRMTNATQVNDHN